MQKKYTILRFLMLTLTLSCSAKTNLSKKQKWAIGGGSAAVGIGGGSAIGYGVHKHFKNKDSDSIKSIYSKRGEFVTETYKINYFKSKHGGTIDKNGNLHLEKDLNQAELKDLDEEASEMNVQKEAEKYDGNSEYDEDFDERSYIQDGFNRADLSYNSGTPSIELVDEENFLDDQIKYRKNISHNKSIISAKSESYYGDSLEEERESVKEIIPNRESIDFLFENQSQNEYEVEEDFNKRKDSSSDENKEPSSGTDSTPQPASTVETQEVPGGKGVSSVGDQVDSDTSAINEGVNNSQSTVQENQQNQGVNTEKGGSTGGESAKPGENSEPTGKGEGGEDIAYDVA